MYKSIHESLEEFWQEEFYTKLMKLAPGNKEEKNASFPQSHIESLRPRAFCNFQKILMRKFLSQFFLTWWKEPSFAH